MCRRVEGHTGRVSLPAFACVRGCSRVAREAFAGNGHAKARPYRWAECVVCQGNASAGRRTHGPCVPTGVCWRSRMLTCSERGVCGKRPWRGVAMSMAECVVCQINVSAGRRTHEPCVPTDVCRRSRMLTWGERGEGG
jgi:hypothetical protein